MLGRGQGLGVDEMIGQRRVAEPVAPHLHGVVDHLLLGAAAILLEHLAGIGIGEDRLDPRGDVAGIEADRPGGRDRGQQGVADAVLGDRRAHVGVHLLHGAAGEVFLGVEQWKRALLAGQVHRGQVGGAGDGVQPVLGLARRRLRAVAQPQHQQRVGEPGDAQPDPALGPCFLGLPGQREFRGIDHVVHHPHSEGDQIGQRLGVEMGVLAEGLGHQPRQVDRAQQAGAIGRQRLLAAGVGGGDGLAIGEVVHRVDPVDEDHPRLGIVIGGAHHPVPQIAGRQGVIDLAAETQVPGRVGLDRGHEGVGHQHREVEHAQPGGIGLGGDEGLDIGVIAAHGRHHRAAAAAGGHDRAAHRVPDIHERERTRGIRRHPRDRGAARADGGKVVPDAAALLHGQRRLLQHLEDAAHAVGDGAHHEAVEERHRARRAGPGGDPPGRQEAEILERAKEPLLPSRGVGLDRREGTGDAPPAVLDRAVDGGAVRVLEPVFHVPDLFGDGGGEAAHEANP